VGLIVASKPPRDHSTLLVRQQGPADRDGTMSAEDEGRDRRRRRIDAPERDAIEELRLALVGQREEGRLAWISTDAN